MRKFLHIIGIETSKERKWHVHLKPRFFIIQLSIVGVILIALLGVAKYSESPSFCNSCHIMGPYYKAWKTSKHNFVACVECHYPPGSPQTILWKKFQALSQVVKYVTRTYSSKPFAEIEDASCLRSGCHSTRLLQGKVMTQRGIKFDHTTHIMEKRKGRQLRCVSCHSQIVVGKHVEVTYDTCYLCHFKGQGEGREFQPLGGCLGCHELPTKLFQIGNMTYNHKDFVTKRGIACQNCHLDVVSGKGEALQDRCFTCHNQPEKLARYGDIPFIHENHVTKHNVACFHCHQEIRHKVGKETSGSAKLPDLNAPLASPSTPEVKESHATLAFDCSFCHQGKHEGQLEMYSGKVTSLGLPEMPSPMYVANVDCIGCHYQEVVSDKEEVKFRGKTFKASEEACVKCHGPKFEGIWEEMKIELETTLAKVEEKLKLVKTNLKEGASKPIAQVERWLHFIHASKGEHNIYLASFALRKADQILSEEGEKLNVKGADLSSLPLLSGGFCATMCHSKVGVKVPPETVKIFGKTMPHKIHTESMSCVTCHELGGHKEVPLKKDIKPFCEGCHTL